MVESRVLVTGGSGGIATALIRSLLAADWSVTVLDRRPPESGLDVDFLQCDLANLESIDATADRLVDAGVPFQGMVHCAGIMQKYSLLEEAREDWMRVMAVNLTGPMALTQRTLPLVSDGGSLVYISSGTVFKGLAAHTAYIASKAGIVGFARSLAAEVGDRGIRVNCVAPGLVATDLVESLAEREPAQIASRALKRSSVPEDIVGAIEFFLSPASAFITGQTLVVDGGSVKH